MRRYGFLPDKLGLAFFGLVLTRYLLRNPRVEPDTLQLLAGAEKLGACLQGGIVSPCPGSEHFPLFQYLPALALRGLGAGDPLVVKVFTLLNAAAFAGLLLLGTRTLAKSVGKWAGWAYALVMIASPLLWYASSTFNESVAAFLTLAVVAAVYNGAHPALAFAAALAAGVTKEVAWPFLLLLGAVAWKISPGSRVRVRRSAIAVAAGAAASLGVNSAFNLLRFGAFANLSNLNPAYRLPSIGQAVHHFAGQWFSPNGGVAFVWAALFVFWVLLAWIVASRARGFREQAPGLVLGCVALALTAGFSLWFAPFGWRAWGPRLLLPWMPAQVFLGLAAYPSRWRDLLARASRSRFAGCGWAGAAAFCVLSFPSLAILFAPHALDQLFATDAVCPKMVTVFERDEYYFCLNHLIWGKSWVMAHFPPLLTKPLVLAHALAYFWALAALLRFLRAGLQSSR